MNVSDNNPNQQFQQQSQQQPSTPQPTSLQQFHVVSSDFTHQTFQKWLDLLVDANSNDEVKLKAITDLSLNLELMQTLPTYNQLIEDAMIKFTKLLSESEPQFITESNVHQLRKKTLEILQRTNPLANLTQTVNYEQRLVFTRDLLTLIYQLIDKENEENVIICFKIIIDYHRYLKNIALTNEVQKFFNFVKNMYRDMAMNTELIFNYKPQLKVHDLSELNQERLLNETYSLFQIVIEKFNNKEGQQIFNFMPRGCKSLKVLAECPFNTVMMCQIHKNFMNQEISDIIMLIISVITLKPTDEQKSNPDLKELIADFVTAQVRALSFIAYFKNHKELIANNSDLLVDGILQLLKNCPPELVSIRKELLGISRHIISDYRQKFLPHITQFFDESTFCSTGYTASELLRSSACSIIVDLVHNVRKQLSYGELCKAITYFSKSIHDPLLYISLQQMCCRVLFSLIECVKAKEQENINAREIILKLLEVFVLKFKSIAKYQVTHLLENNNSNNNNNSTNNSSAETTAESTKSTSESETPKEDKKTKQEKLDLFLNNYEDKDKIKLKFGPSSLTIQSEMDCRITIRFLISASRSITSVLIDSKLAPSELSFNMQPKQLSTRETQVFIKLLKNCLLSLDIYILSRKQAALNTAVLSAQQKEEKESIETLGSIYAQLNVHTLKEIFTQTIEFLIERTFKNPNLTALSSYFLATPATSCTFATILIEYLLKQMEMMGDSSIERSNLYLKLFKLVFGSVSVFPAENEKMLKPHLHTLVNKSLEYALKAKEPYNYFLLLRALFRSIGGGNHDLLYQEFLPLLPILLQSLNELQTGVHKQYLKDLFVELCLTVPVRLSSLLPYLPMLMDPLVSALNGSPTLVSQGLRTLELCVDNLLSDYLYDHIQPVRTDLIQGLWRTLRCQNETIAVAAYRVLGKLGGNNRKMIVEPQKLAYNKSQSSVSKEFNGPIAKVSFPGYTGFVELSLDKAIEASLSILKSSSSAEPFYKKNAFKLVASFLASLVNSTLDSDSIYNLFLNFNPSTSSTFTQYLIKATKFTSDEQMRKMVEQSLSSLFYASHAKEIRAPVLRLLDSITIHFTLISLSLYLSSSHQGDETNTSTTTPNVNSTHLDFMILVDSLFEVLCHDDTEYWPCVQRVILLMIETSELVSYDDSAVRITSVDNIYRPNLVNLALFDYLAEKVGQLCYERSWYAKKAGCFVIRLLSRRMPFIWVLNNSYAFIRSLMFILVAVTGEISSGAIEIAQTDLESLLKLCFAKIRAPSSSESAAMYTQLVEQQQKSLNDVLRELIRQITSLNNYVRKQSIGALRLLSELQSKPLSALIQPFSDILVETVAPRKHLKLRHYSVQAQIGILEGVEFCSSTQPQQLFTLTMSNAEHESMFQELLPLCEGDEQSLSKSLCYKGVELTPLRIAALNCLASFYHLLEQRETILSTLHRSLASPNEEIQKTSFKCLKRFIANTEQYGAAMKAAAASAAASASTSTNPASANSGTSSNTTPVGGANPSGTPTSTTPGSTAPTTTSTTTPTTTTSNPVLDNLRPTMQIAADYLREYLHPLTDYTSLDLGVMQHLSYITQLYPTILNEKFSEYLLSHLRRWLDDVLKIMKENADNPTNPPKSYANEIKLCSAIISLLAELQSAPAKLVEGAISTIVKYEKAFALEVSGAFRQPLCLLLKRYPIDTLKFLIHSDRIKDPYYYRFILYLFRKHSASFGQVFKVDSTRLIQMLNESQTLFNSAPNQQNPQDYINKSNQIQYLSILITYRLCKLDTQNEWIVAQAPLMEVLLRIWCDERFHDKHRNIDQLDHLYWKEPLYMVKILLKFHKCQLNRSSNEPHCYPISSNIELLFKLLIAFQYKSLHQYEFLRLYYKDVVAKEYSCEWKRVAFFTFVKIFSGGQIDSTPTDPNNPQQPQTAAATTNDPSKYMYSQKLKANILQYVLIPCFQHAFEQNQQQQLIGGPPQPDVDSPDNIISVFINRVIDPEPPTQQPGQQQQTNQQHSDSVRIFLLQLSSLFVQYAHDYIHDVNNKKQGQKLRRLMTFAWPCLLAKTCVDPFNKYHGMLLLSHIIAKFAIHKRIVLQVFHSLLKGYAPEAKLVVRQALDILTPTFPTRNEDGYGTLATWVKKILIEENHSIPQLAHIIYIIVKYHKVFYLIRHSLINHLISSFQKVGLSNNSQPENRTLAIDLTETILRWEAQRIKDTELANSADHRAQYEAMLVKHPDMLRPFDKHVADCLLNFFVRIACQTAADQAQAQASQQQGQQSQSQQTNQSDTLSKRCLNLFQTAITNDIWPQADLKLEFIERIMLTLESTVQTNPLLNNQHLSSPNSQQQQQQQQQMAGAQPNYANICTCIEIVTILVEQYGNNRAKLTALFRSIQRGMALCLSSTNSRVIKSVSPMITRLMGSLPIEIFNNNPLLSNPLPSTVNSGGETGGTTTQQQSPSSSSSAATVVQPNDPIYQLFGQPEGTLCRTILESLSYYEKTSNDLASSTTGTTGSAASPVTPAADVLSNCLCLLKAASANNPQYIDRIMGPFMKILQKLYRDHLNSTGAGSGIGSTSSSSTSTSASAVTQVPPSSASAEGSNFMFVGPVIPGQGQQQVNASSELLIQSIDLIKYRIGVMSIEMRKMFINTILVTLIDKSIDLRLIRFLVKVISDWVKYKSGGALMNQMPSMKEKLTLLQRLTACMEKRFGSLENQDLHKLFLDTIAYVYSNDMYITNVDFKLKLEQAFIMGMKSPNPQLRHTFFELFNRSFASYDLYERLCYIIVTQNWELFGAHFWIKQCIQLTLGSCANAIDPIRLADLTSANKLHLNGLPECIEPVSPDESQSTPIGSSSDLEIEEFCRQFESSKHIASLDQIVTLPQTTSTTSSSEPSSSASNNDQLVAANVRLLSIYSDYDSDSPDAMQTDSVVSRAQLLRRLVDSQAHMLTFAQNASLNSNLISSLCQLCHLATSNELAHLTWVQLFIQMFNILSPKQQQMLYGELTPFIASGSHVLQKQLIPFSTLNTFIESFSLAKPVALYLRPQLLAYLAKNHCLWHRGILLLENSLNTAYYNHLTPSAINELALDSAVQHETFAVLSQLFGLLREDDYRSGLWLAKSSVPQPSLHHHHHLHSSGGCHDITKLALVYEQQGLFYQAQKLYEEAIAKSLEFYINEPSISQPDELLEFNLWEEKWIKCCRELNQWNELCEYSSTKDYDLNLNLECAWKHPTASNWQAMKSILLAQKDTSLPKDQAWRWSLYQGYYLVCNPDDYHHLMLSHTGSSQHLFLSPSAAVDSKVERCMLMALKEWRRLPRLVSPSHMTLLQAAQQIIELKEAFQIQNNLYTLGQLAVAGASTPLPPNINPSSILQEIKGIIKTWRTRLPLINDDISYWNDIFTWRQYHYDAFSRFYEKQQQQQQQSGAGNTNTNQAMLGVHALAQGIVHFGKIARKQHLYDLCLETLNKIHKKQSVPIIDCFLKVKQELKCYINTFEFLTPKQSNDLLDVIEATNLRYFNKENVAELISLKAHFLQLCSKYDDANHLYSFSIYLNDAQPRLWGAWGDYLCQMFVEAASKAAAKSRPNEIAESALIALLHAARHPNSEPKTRKYISKILWLLSYDTAPERRQLYANFEHYSSSIPASNWINWIPQLITLLMRNDDTGKYLFNLMIQIVRTFPLALYYPLRTLYLKLKNDEQTEKLKNQLLAQQKFQQQQQTGSASSSDVEMKDVSSGGGNKPATAISGQQQQQQQQSADSLIRVTTLMHRQREMHPTLFNTLEGLIDQLLTLKVHWCEELLRNFKQTLYQAYAYAFDSLGKKSEQDMIDPFSIMWFKKIHKFYFDSYWEKLQQSAAARTTQQNQQQSSSLSQQQGTNSGTSTPIPTSNTSLLAAAMNNQQQQQLQQPQNQRLRGLLAILNDPNYQLTKQKFLADFNFQQPTSVNVHTFIAKLKQWIALIETHLVNSMPRQHLLDERFKFVTQFCSSTADIELPGEYLIPRSTNYYVRISRFMPLVESVERYNSYCRRISIRGHNGKIYPFLISNEATYYYECRKEEHVMQLMRMVNTYLSKQKETASRALNYALPRLVSLSAEVRMIEDDCSSISLFEIYKTMMRKQNSTSAKPGTNEPSNYDAPLNRYFENNGGVGNANGAVELFRSISSPGSICPPTMMRQWALQTYPDATDYFQARKHFTSQLAMYNLAEYAFGLTRMQPDHFYFSQQSGICQSIRLKFDLNESASVASCEGFNTPRPVPFRLTPNLVDFISLHGVHGPLTSNIIALARCLVQPQYHFGWLLRAILKDEILNFMNKRKQDDISKTGANSTDVESEALINLVNKLVGQIESRLKDCASLETGKSQVINDLIPRAISAENLSKMDPLWFPWF